MSTIGINFHIVRISGLTKCVDMNGSCGIVFGRCSETESCLIVASDALEVSIATINNANLENPSTPEQVNIIKNNENNIITAIKSTGKLSVEKATLNFPSFELYQGVPETKVLKELLTVFESEQSDPMLDRSGSV